MYNALLVVMILSVGLLLAETAYVMSNMTSRVHSCLFIYLVAALINNCGYCFEMTARSSEAAYVATRFLYFGKVFFPVALFVFIIRYCRVNMPKKVSVILFMLHALVFFAVATNEWHHLYYTSVEFVNTGLFPHNVYGHGPLYYVYQSAPIFYLVITFIICFMRYKKLQTKEEKRMLLILFLAPATSVIGLAAFMTGKTKGFDTTNLGICISSVFMVLPLFKSKLIETSDLVRNDLVNNLSDGILAIDSYGSIAYMNVTVKNLFPSLQEGKDTSVFQGIVDDLDRRVKARDMLSLNGRTYSLTKQEIRQNGIYRGILYHFDDMTETIRYTKEIETERDRADEANAAKSRFLSNMSHEIRTPMNAIVGMTDILLREDFSEQDISYLENIKSSGNALLDIINDILDFSKIESGKMEIINSEYEPLPLFNDLKMIFITRIGDKPIRLVYEIDDELPAKLLGDSVRIRQVIINLVNNAIKFTEVGYVRLVVKAEKKDSDSIILNVSVRDTGSGIKPEDIDRLFDSFAQVDIEKNHFKEGTGLGLPISKQIIELMGGTVNVVSEYGKGSEFSFSIPQHVVDSTPANMVTYKRRSTNPMDFVAPNARILLVEDNEINVKVAKGLFEPLKFKMDVAENGLASLKKVAENRYDLVFMDHLMPVMDGMEATGRIRTFNSEDDYYKKLPIIALTANATTGAKAKLVEAGMNDFVSKPISVNDVCAILRKWLPENLIEDIDVPEGAVAGEFEEILSDTNAQTHAEGRMSVEKGYLNKEIGIQYCGTEELYQSVLEDFYRLIDTKAAKIEELLDHNDIRNYTIEVHALKSTARMIGASELSDLAFRMEQAGNENDLDSITSNTPKLMEMYRAYKETLSYFDRDSSDEKDEVPSSVIKAELLRMNLAAKDFDMDAVDSAMQKITNFKMPNDELVKLVEVLDTMVRDVALEDIKDLTSKIAKML